MIDLWPAQSTIFFSTCAVLDLDHYQKTQSYQSNQQSVVHKKGASKLEHC